MAVITLVAADFSIRKHKDFLLVITLVAADFAMVVITLVAADFAIIICAGGDNIHRGRHHDYKMCWQ